jgi:hypothetical protein
MSKVSSEFLSIYFILVLEEIFISLFLGKIFCMNAGKEFPNSNNQEVAFGRCRK